MMMRPSDYPEMDKLCNEVLTEIELAELKLLNWGFVDVRSPLEASLPDVLTRLTGNAFDLWDEAQRNGISPDHILDNLLNRQLLFKATISGQSYYRSRFAETIRLLALLRQRFSHGDWQTGSRLVSDFKIEIKRRSYPKRDVAFDEVRADLVHRRATPLYIEAVGALLQEHGRGLPLARFQKLALLQQYDALHNNESTSFHEHALVIGAGTGAGKTKAFYVPAMAEIAATLSQDRYVRAMAIYPRVELLKDQLIEAFQEARKLDTLLDPPQRKPRKITLGAYYYDTPLNAQVVLDGKSSWRETRTRDGWECPFFFCSKGHQPQPFVWPRENLEEVVKHKNRRALLHCPNCFENISSEELLLTREQMINTPPDILFTTTEMLNRRMSKADEHRLFGCHMDGYPPSLLLLDEIHTYEGLKGAQIAYLLRRWRYNRRLGTNGSKPLCCVGLSATLKEAETFFAKLTGIPKHRVSYVHPEDGDLEEWGAEYNVLLKGDPVAATNLLSTSVQTVMLLARMLDSRQKISHGAYGQKVFAFSDKLDVTNRWYHIELDAEQKQKLSQYRAVSGYDKLRREKARAGQDWSISERIGHILSQPLKIDRVTSQDRGVNSNAQLVIATSTLEVGYNDPTVGAVIQHKAPHSLASFLQRKGRAGRERHMRPWMVVVTSEYGRDRWAFQHEEKLFSPLLSTIDLPIENHYVRKMQAAYAFMDWLSLQLKQQFTASRINIWGILNGKPNEYYKQQRDAVSQIVKDVLTNEASRQNFAQYLRNALDLHNQREVDELLWEEPRPLLFAVLPTVLRQLETKWRDISSNPPKEWVDVVTNNPLPEFVTPNLFSDLQTFEVPLYLPLSSLASQNKSALEEPEMLAIYQSLVEFAPGNVSKRYATSRSGQEAHWVPLPEQNKNASLRSDRLSVELLSNWITCEKYPYLYTIEDQTYQLYMPRKYVLEQIPKEIKSTSNAHLFWKSHFEGKAFKVRPENEESWAESLSLAKRSRWRKFLAEIRSYTHASGGGVEIVRLAVGLHADIRYEGKSEASRRWIEFLTDEHKEGIGFINHVDALRFDLQPLNVEECLALSQWPELLKALRPEYFRARLRAHELARQRLLSHFELEWLWQLELSMLVSQAVAKSCELYEAAQVVQQSRVELADEMMKMIFQTQQAEDAGEEKVGRLHEKLRTLIQDNDIQQLLNECEQVLWKPCDDTFYNWLQQCYASSLGAALFAAVTRLAPDIDPDDLHMDLDGDSIWISEAVPGGIGIIPKIVESIKARPHEFDLQMRDTLAFCDRQHLGDQLQVVAEHIAQDDQELSQLFARLREDDALTTQQKALDQLKSALEQRGISASRDFMVALFAKFLRPNSADDSDQLIASLVQFWQQEEQYLQCALDLRIIAAAARANASIESQVKTLLWRINGDEEPEQSQIFNVLQSLLWFSCNTSCPDCIEENHPFQELVKPSRQFLLALLLAGERVVIYGGGQWFEQVKRELATAYQVRILCPQEQLADCKKYLLHLLIEPIDIGFQFFYPLIERVTRTGKLWTIEMRIWELAYV